MFLMETHMIQAILIAMLQERGLELKVSPVRDLGHGVKWGSVGAGWGRVPWGGSFSLAVH